MDPETSPAGGISGRGPRAASHRTWALRLAAVALFIDGFGFGAVDFFPIWSLSIGRGLPTVLGWPTYGGGPFESYGIRSTIPLLALFLALCIGQVVASWMVWRGRRAGAVLALVLLPVSAVFWWGFALPVGPVLGVLWTTMIVVGWPALRR